MFSAPSTPFFVTRVPGVGRVTPGAAGRGVLPSAHGNPSVAQRDGLAAEHAISWAAGGW